MSELSESQDKISIIMDSMKNLLIEKDNSVKILSSKLQNLL